MTRQVLVQSRSTLSKDPQELREQLASYLLKRAHPEKERLLGLEYECLRASNPDCAAAPSMGDGGPEDVVDRLGQYLVPEGMETERVVDGGVLSIVHAGKSNLSLEPGGQVEVSFAPMRTPQEIERSLNSYIHELERVHEGTPYKPLYVGHQPRTLPDDIPLRAKPRYAIMDRRLRQVEELGPHMMRATAGQQLTVDFRSERECLEMLQASFVFAPFMTALFANSPFVGGRDSGYVSYREKAWWHTDPSRCGVPSGLFQEGADIQSYVDFALQAEVWFRWKDGELIEVEERQSFGDLWESGEELLLDDFAVHSSTLFPASRLRGGLEIRSADCTPKELVPSFVALAMASMYDEKTREACMALHPYRCPIALAELHEKTAEDGLKAVLDDGFAIGKACLEFLDLCESGLVRMAERGELEAGSERLLRPIREIADRGESVAHEALRQYESYGCIC